MTAPWLSVIVPTFNGADYLPAALASLEAQRDDNLEIIAIDDGSNDATVSILESFQSRLPLRILQNKASNWAINTNLALNQARSPWCCFLHQDDLWRADRLAALKPITAEGEAFIVTAARFLDPAGRSVGNWTCPWNPGHNAPEQAIRRLIVQNFVPLPGALFPTAWAKAAGGLAADYWFTADWDLWLKLAAMGPTKYIPKPLAGFRLHPQSQTVTRSGRSAEFRSQYEMVRNRHFDLWQSAWPDAEAARHESQLSIEINVALAARLHGERINWRPLLGAFRKGAPSLLGMLKNSRIYERTASRLRVQSLRKPVN